MQTQGSTPLTDMLSEAKGLLGDVLEGFPAAADGRAWLEEAIEKVGRLEDEIEAVERND